MVVCCPESEYDLSIQVLRRFGVDEFWVEVVSIRKKALGSYEELFKLVQLENSLLKSSKLDGLERIDDAKKLIMFRVNKGQLRINDMKASGHVSLSQMPEDVGLLENKLSQLIVKIDKITGQNIALIEKKLGEVKGDLSSFGKKKVLEKHFDTYKNTERKSSIIDGRF